MLDVPGTRRLLVLAGSAFLVLAAEPTYVLVDTAVVGHLGPTPLGALGLGGTLLSLIAMLGSFLDYATTARAARWFGAGRRDLAVDEGVAASVLALGVGLAGVIVGEALSRPMLVLLAGGPGTLADAAERWFRVAVLGLPGMLVVLAGNGWMRGVQDTKRPVAIVVAANVASAAASPVLVYAVGLGLVGSAVANLGAQTVAGAFFVAVLRAEQRPWRPSRETMVGFLRPAKDLLARKAGLQLSILAASAVAARMGTAQIAAHQIGYECWAFVSLLLDSFAIAAQSLVGAALGAGDPATARRIAWQVAGYGAAAGAFMGVVLAAGWSVIPDVFTAAAPVRRQVQLLWPFLAGMQPAAGVVFALDGVLIGAGDVRYMRDLTLVATLGVYLPLGVAAWQLHWGIQGLWAGLTASIVVRLAGMLRRTVGSRWSAA
ncbi:MAG: MATE family efflux transporter [Acidimicrobiales bacterium]